MTATTPDNGELARPLSPIAQPQNTSAQRPAAIKLVREPGKTEERQIADLVVAGVGANALTFHAFHPQFAGLSVQECMVSLQATAGEVAGGDLSSAERMLAAQAITLNAIFTEMAGRAARGIDGTNLQRTETFLRMALKAQSQSRCTVETLAAIKQGPTIFARQANITNGGPQQVNNGIATEPQSVRMTGEQSHRATASARKKVLKTVDNQLLEAGNGKRVDFGAPRTTGRVDSNLETVGVVNRPANPGGEGASGDARQQGRAVEAGARDARRAASRDG